MTRSHNIVGCEAAEPGRRLVEFSHVHGAMRWGGPRRRRSAAAVLIFLAGAAGALAAIAIAVRLIRSLL